MTEQLQFPDSRHNHQPRCCCGPAKADPCPACPQHGQLAPGVECPQCHQTAGRPHTEYCPLAIREDIFAGPSTPSQMLPGQTPPAALRDTQYVILPSQEPEHRTSEIHWHPISQCTKAWCGYTPADFVIGQTSQPATRTSQPHTDIRSPLIRDHDEWHRTHPGQPCELTPLATGTLPDGCTGSRVEQAPGIQHHEDCPVHGSPGL